MIHNFEKKIFKKKLHIKGSNYSGENKDIISSLLYTYIKEKGVFTCGYESLKTKYMSKRVFQVKNEERGVIEQNDFMVFIQVLLRFFILTWKYKKLFEYYLGFSSVPKNELRLNMFLRIA